MSCPVGTPRVHEGLDDRWQTVFGSLTRKWTVQGSASPECAAGSTMNTGTARRLASDRTNSVTVTEKEVPIARTTCILSHASITVDQRESA